MTQAQFVILAATMILLFRTVWQPHTMLFTHYHANICYVTKEDTTKTISKTLQNESVLQDVDVGFILCRPSFVFHGVQTLL